MGRATAKAADRRRTVKRPSPGHRDAGESVSQASTAQQVQIIVDRLYEQHPEWWSQWGERGRRFAEQDNRHHLDFLNAAVGAGDPGLFEAYADWTRQVLEARGVAVSALIENFEVMRQALPDGPHHDLLDGAIRRLQNPPAAAPASAPKAPGPAAPTAPTAPAGPAALSGLARQLLDALLIGARRDAVSVLSQADPKTLADELVVPVMVEVGRRWQANEISVAREHLATATCRAALAQIDLGDPPPAVYGKALLACVEGNRHALGLTLLADQLEVAGWETQVLGADVPNEHLIRHVEEWQPDLVCLSLALPTHLRAARALIKQLRAAGAPRVVVGGRLVRDFPETGRLTGADAWPATVTQALSTLT